MVRHHSNKKISTGFLLCLGLMLLGVIVFVIMPDSASRRAQEVCCRERILKLGSALFVYANDHGAFPPSNNSVWQLLIKYGYLENLEFTRCPVDGQMYDYRCGTPPWQIPKVEPTWLVKQKCVHATENQYAVAFFTDGSIKKICLKTESDSLKGE